MDSNPHMCTSILVTPQLATRNQPQLTSINKDFPQASHSLTSHMLSNLDAWGELCGNPDPKHPNVKTPLRSSGYKGRGFKSPHTGIWMCTCRKSLCGHFLGFLSAEHFGLQITGDWLKGESNKIFDLRFFSSLKPAWAIDLWVKIFC